MRPKRKRAAWVQGTVLVVAIAAIGAAAVFQAQRPFNEETLALAADQLRSLAAETAKLTDIDLRGDFATAVRRNHASQLVEKVRSLATTLRSRPAEAGLDTKKGAAAEIAESLERLLDASASAAPARDAGPARSLSTRAGALAREIESAR